MNILQKLPSPMVLWIFALGVMHFVVLQWPKDQISWWPEGAGNSLVWLSYFCVLTGSVGAGLVYRQINKKRASAEQNENRYINDIAFFNGINKFLFIFLIISSAITIFLFVIVLMLPVLLS